jgi:murein tripeptide amidase MpaA
MKLFLTTLTILATQAMANTSYQGYQVLRTSPLTQGASALLRELQLNTNSLDFWSDPITGRSTDINTPPELLSNVKDMLASHGVDVSTMIEDVEKLIKETEPAAKSVKSDGKRYAMNWDDYQRHDVLNEFIEALADANDFASIINIGQSYEGRDMKVLAITKAGPGAPNIFLESGIHAREWVSPAVATYLVRQLVEEYSDHPDYLDKINWYFIPSANPDGYEYTFTNDRLWRKTRSDNGGSSGCKGVDPNRNWGFHWAEAGVSHDPCSEVFCGPEAFSEVEMQNIRDFVQTLDPVPAVGWCFHSYSQLWLWPYGYGYDAYPDNYQEIKKLAEDASDALYQVHGTVFDPINSADLYPAAGAADDWYKSIGMRYVFTTELRDTGRYGFVLPKEQIIPSGEEMWAGFETVVHKVLADMQ